LKESELEIKKEKKIYLLKKKKILAKKQLEYSKKYYHNGGKEKIQHNNKYREYQKQWAKNLSPEKKLANYQKNRETYRKRDCRRRALKLNCQIIVPYTKTEIIKKDGLICYLCGKTLLTNEVSLDHVLPLSRGENDKPENIKIACKSCNSSKGAKTLTEFKKWRGDYRFLKNKYNK